MGWQNYRLFDLCHGPFGEESNMGGRVDRFSFAEEASQLQGVCDRPRQAGVSALGEMTLPWAVLFLLSWVRQRMLHGDRLEKVKRPRKSVSQVSQVRIWTDAKATEDRAWIGGWLEEAQDTKACRWYALEVTEVSAPWLLVKGRDPKRVIAVLELMATIVAMKLWIKGTEERAEIMTEAFTDNRANSFIVKKGLSTKYPITSLVIELAETLRNRDAYANLTWVPQEENTLADALTNPDFSAFDMGVREELDESGIEWLVMGEPIESSKALFEEIKAHKQLKKESHKNKTKKSHKFFGRWTS